MRLLVAGLLLLASGTAFAANLDVTAGYKMKAVSYSNLNLEGAIPNNRRFIENDARLGLAVRKIYLETLGSEDTTMDVGLVMRALGVSNSTQTLTAPLDRVANNYPQTNMTPFIENAYLRVNNMFGKPVEGTF